MALLSSALLIRIPFLVCVAKPPIAIDDLQLLAASAMCKGSPSLRSPGSIRSRTWDTLSTQRLPLVPLRNEIASARADEVIE
jgi:hypothetical protein